MRKNLFFVLTGPSGAGKSTLIRGVKDSFDLAFSFFLIRRPPREGEVEGKDYYFVEKQVFDEMLERGDFLEWTEVYGNRYGTTKAEVERLLKTGKDLILDLDLRGALNVRKYFKDAIIIFIGTESLGELKSRLEKRGEKNMETRVSSAKDALRVLDNFDYLIINRELEKSLKALESIFFAEHLRIKNINLSEYKEGFFK